MDTLYLRGFEEERYVKALSEFTVNAPPSIHADMHPECLLHSRPFLSRPWITSGRKTLDPEREFPRQGQVQLPHETFARDFGYAFYISSLMAGEGDPGRFTEELRKEHKYRRAGVLLSWAQVDYYRLPPGLRKTLYPQTPERAEWECPAGRQPALADLLRRVGTQRHRAVHNRRASSRSLVALTPKGHRQNLHFGSSFPPGGHSLRRGEGDPIIGAYQI
jgi:hypothetical protein